MNRQKRAVLTLKELTSKYSDFPRTGLKNWRYDWQLLFAIILSARSNDDQINKLTPKLFNKYSKLTSFANAGQEQIARDIKSSGFYNAKAKHLHQAAILILEQYEGKVPRKLNQLVTIPGVGRKTANVFQGVIYAKSEGIAVDTHVARMSRRLRLTKEKTAEKIEKDLMELFPRSKYYLINPILFWHGRTICQARKPKCEDCALNYFCPSSLI
ncbi:MAG: endonuclease III [Candidatus Dojkabacteria bacterium]|nr:endonuclease III [Candidatus Dojkabacteria bacterium]